MTPREAAAATARKATATRRKRTDPAVRAEQQLQIVNGLIAGLSVDEICRVTGLSSATVAREKRKIVEAKTAERETAVTELREIELARLDRLQRGHFAAACDGNVHSAKVVLQCIAQRSKMLGLDAPVKVDVQERTQLDAQIEQLLTELEGVGVKVKQ